jgi:hypothetical protein
MLLLALFEARPSPKDLAVETDEQATGWFILAGLSAQTGHRPYAAQIAGLVML